MGHFKIILTYTFLFFFLATFFRGWGPADEGSSAPQNIQHFETAESSEIKIIDVDTAYQFYQEGSGFLFIDVRTREEYSQGHIKGAVNIPLSEIGGRLDEIPKEKKIVVYCNGSSCDRSGKAAKILIQNGYTDVYDLGDGGVMEWMFKEYPHEKE